MSLYYYDDYIIQGGTIDGTIIGETTPAAGAFTTLKQTTGAAAGAIPISDAAGAYTLTASTGTGAPVRATSPTLLGMTNNGAYHAHRTAVGAADYNPSILTTDYIIAMTDTAAARAVIISTEDEDTGTTDNPRVLVIKDESGGAAANNITVTLESGGTIDGAASYVINQNYQSITLYVDSVNAHIY